MEFMRRGRAMLLLGSSVCVYVRENLSPAGSLGVQHNRSCDGQDCKVFACVSHYCLHDGWSATYTLKFQQYWTAEESAICSHFSFQWTSRESQEQEEMGAASLRDHPPQWHCRLGLVGRWKNGSCNSCVQQRPTSANHAQSTGQLGQPFVNYLRNCRLSVHSSISPLKAGSVQLFFVPLTNKLQQ